MQIEPILWSAFYVDGMLVRTEKDIDEELCERCVFKKKRCENLVCTARYRHDHYNVHFTNLEEAKR